jgi:predicted nucleotidyltransferase
MNPNDPNIYQIQLVANALGALRDQLVFVGGCATGLLITDLARPPVRATKDVDLIAEVTTKSQYYDLAEQLRQLGFQEDVGEVVCRWKLDSLIIDVMPTTEGVLNFTNIWYESAVRESVAIKLPNGIPIRLVTAPYFIATKLEAFYGRGQGQFHSSHDIEDVINLIDGRESVAREIKEQQGKVQSYLKTEIDSLISDPSFLEAVPAHFRPNATDQARVPIVLARLREIAGV